MGLNSRRAVSGASPTHRILHCITTTTNLTSPSCYCYHEHTLISSPTTLEPLTIHSVMMSSSTPSRNPKPSPLSHLSPGLTPIGGPARTVRRTPSGALNQLSATQIGQLKESFQLLDKDGDGAISSSDLSSMLASLGLDSSSAATTDYLAAVGAPFNLASYLTHLSQHLSLLSPTSELLAAFEAFDEGDDGTVDVRELKASLVGLGERMTPEQVDMAVKGFTRRGKLGGGGGEVFRYREFVDTLAGKNGEDEEEEKE
ncbi:hypothetical protein EDC01DRAFT_646982, partial [Geopyxis carbonaria]